MDKKVFLLGAETGVAEKASKKLSEQLPGLKVVGAEEGIKKINQKLRNLEIKKFFSNNIKLVNDILIYK